MNIHEGADQAIILDQPDMETMAVVLEARHGTYAAHVADFFAIAHDHEGDHARGQAWSGVATLVRRREHDRLRQV